MIEWGNFPRLGVRWLHVSDRNGTRRCNEPPRCARRKSASD
jgi:hypothetical protein